MGSVYRGVHLETGQQVAIKVLATEMAKERRFRDRFISEIETLKRLTHPNIVRLIGYPKDDQGPLFYSMELVEGPSLLEHLRKVKRLDWDTTIGFAIEVCSALKHAHDIGVIHRDLKPANLLLEPEGGIKLTDFGIAKLFGASEQTVAGSVLGTADYMAPEQASGGPITARTDLYALGSLMYACLAGRPPFGGRNLTQVIHGLKHETPPPLDLVLPDVPPELAELIHELLEKQPEDRPPTALVVGKRLGALRAGLRRRGELTRYDTDSQTLPEVPLDSPSNNPLIRQSGAASAADFPTAAEVDFDGSTGSDIGLQKTLASDVHLPGNPTGGTAIVTDPPEPGERKFETLAEATAGKTDWRKHVDTDSTARNWWSIAILTLFLVVCIGGLVTMFRKPSADELYQRFETARAGGDRAAMRNAIDVFLRTYGDDDRADELQDALPTKTVMQMIRKLRGRLSGTGYGPSELSTAEETWMRAVELRNKKPTEAKRLLRAWLAVYDHPQAFANEQLNLSESESRTIEELIELATVELQRLETTTSDQSDPRLEELQNWIRWGEENLQGEQLIEFNEGIRALFEDKPWATPLLENI
jgi:serine/threonine-protein kinase